MLNDKLQRFFKTLGPGIMFAGTCIGGSHLVQSTRAGADYGFSLLLLIMVTNIMKYPFFEFSSRYANGTGNSILEGYAKVGKWVLACNAVLTFFSMFVVTAAIGFVTAGLTSNLFGLEAIAIDYILAGLFAVVFLLLIIGKFSLLDEALKVIGLVLVVSVLASVFMVLAKGRPAPVAGFVPLEVTSEAGYLFLISLMGWMPMGVDMSVWHSLWTQERIKQTGYWPTLKETRLDFNIGYVITMVLAACFLTLGAYVLYGSGVALSDKSTVFAHQLVSMFSNQIGAWSYLVIAIAAFSTMFGTSLTLVDGYCRTIDRTLRLLFTTQTEKQSRQSYVLWMFALLVGSFLIVRFGITLKVDGKSLLNFKKLIDMATSVSFIIAPVAAILNFKVMFNSEVPESHRPSFLLTWWARLGVLFLVGFSCFYIYIIV